MRGDRMEELRESLGLSRDGLGKMLNTSRVTIWRWEKGGSEPDDETKVTLARILNTTAAYLMGETNEPGSQAQKKPSPIGPDLKHNIISVEAGIRQISTGISRRAVLGMLLPKRDRCRGEKDPRSKDIF